MKRIRFLQSISGYGSPDRNTEGRFAFSPDQEVEIEDDIATAWTESGIAEFISQAPVEPITPTIEYAVARRGPGRPAKAIVVVPDADVTEDTKEG